MEEDVKQVRLGVEGADVQILKVVLGWDNRPDTTLNAVGTVKAEDRQLRRISGTQRAPHMDEDPSKILGKAPTATVKIMGLD